MKILFVLSVVANIGLVSYLVVNQSPDLQSNPEVEVTSQTTYTDLQEFESTSTAASSNSSVNYQSWIDKGLSSKQAKHLVLQELSEKHIETLEPPKDLYWEQDPRAAQAEYFLSRLDAQEKVREDLLAQFGEQAKTDPVFLSVFQPMAIQAPYLQSDEQIAFQRVRAVQQLSMLDQDLLSLFKQNGGMIPASAMPNISLPQEPTSSLSLTSKREHDLRNSSVADTLRSSGMNFDEISFREAFELVEQMLLPGQNSTPYQRSLALEELTEMIGESSAKELWTQVDPGFGAIVVAGEKHGLSDQEIRMAYEIIGASYQSIMDIQDLRERDPQAAAEVFRSAMIERREQLSGRFGQAAADAILRAPRTSIPILPGS